MIPLISFDNFLIEDTSPIYQQIIYFVQRGIVAGSIENGDEMPSRRVLSAWIGVNPNTIQKAYRILEDEGIIASRSGAKSCVTIDEEKIRRIRSSLLTRDTQSLIMSMKQMGISMNDALALVESAWKEESNDEK
ncbi:GntR family transcriptional regulator [Ihubacter sp. rT4E-8]|uniref:GntR family transcriptional regulator n=1 Tax=unclassified Ihubacter TaxID=2633299 RepID=UPI003C7A3C51